MDLLVYLLDDSKFGIYIYLFYNLFNYAHLLLINIIHF